MMPFYSRAGLRKDREERRVRPSQPEQLRAEVPEVSADAPYLEPEKTIHVFETKTGRFLPCQKWLATVHIERDEPPPQDLIIGDNASRVTATCGRTQVSLIKEAERWFMYAASHGPAARRTDFTSPFLQHSIRTAEEWYGAPESKWQAEDKKRRADVSTAECDGELAAGSKSEGYR